jgi:hypothetical protein
MALVCQREQRDSSEKYADIHAGGSWHFASLSLSKRIVKTLQWLEPPPKEPLSKYCLDSQFHNSEPG